MRTFTLVELLVVCAIISILASILISSISGVRERSKRSVCLSQQSQLHKAQMVFAKNNNQKVSIGYRNEYQFNYLMTYQGEPIAWGLLYHQKILEDPQAYFCPSYDSESKQYNTSSNPWMSSNKSRASFGTRPMLQGQEFRWNSMPSADTNNGVFTKLPFISQFNSETLLSDSFSSAAHFPVVHENDGLNITYVDGSGLFKNHGSWSDHMKSIPNGFSPTYDNHLETFWENMDGFR
ncbi:MAG: prepilin-type N-terminal cleavage/methylation domain-containing protein [Lentisphaeraceae bacterium]|nr:prepilin-type N-terminal cleavage/methylation domain-containing protein [Lentisphaeraceae bacterium]